MTGKTTSSFRGWTAAIAFGVCGFLSLGRADIISNDGSANGARDAARNAAMAAARGELSRATSQLTATTERVRATWKAAPEMISATDGVAAARKDYQAARAAVVARLKGDPTYQAALKEHAETQVALRAEQQRTNATQPASTQPGGAVEAAPNLPTPSADQVEVASQKLEAKTRLRSLEDTAVANDPNAAKAQAKLNVAEQAAKAMQLQFEAALKNDPEYRAALDQVQAARSHMAQAAGANY